jgi:hypothetical protein
MELFHRRKGFILFLAATFLCVIGAEASSGHVAVALVVTGFGLFVAALHGTAESSKARLPLFAFSVALNVTAVGLMVTGQVV